MIDLWKEEKKNPWDHRRSDKNSSFSQNFVSWMLKLGNSSNKSRQVFSCWSFSKFPWISRKTTSSPSSSEIKTCSTFRPNFSEFPLNSFPSSKDSPGAWKSLQIEKTTKKPLNYERWKLTQIVGFFGKNKNVICIMYKQFNLICPPLRIQHPLYISGLVLGFWSSNVVGIICPLGRIGLTSQSKSAGARQYNFLVKR